MLLPEQANYKNCGSNYILFYLMERETKMSDRLSGDICKILKNK